MQPLACPLNQTSPRLWWCGWIHSLYFLRECYAKVVCHFSAGHFLAECLKPRFCSADWIEHKSSECYAWWRGFPAEVLMEVSAVAFQFSRLPCHELGPCDCFWRLPHDQKCHVCFWIRVVWSQLRCLFICLFPCWDEVMCSRRCSCKIQRSYPPVHSGRYVSKT